jgi:hypothetical protein
MVRERAPGRLPLWKMRRRHSLADDGHAMWYQARVDANLAHSPGELHAGPAETIRRLVPRGLIHEHVGRHQLGDLPQGSLSVDVSPVAI